MNRADLIVWAAQTCMDYEKRGYLLTLRQLYYQGVAQGVISSGQKHYKHLDRVLAEERKKGKFPLNALVDRTRVVTPGQTTRNDANVKRALDRAVQAVQNLPEALLVRDRWLGQPVHVSIWFEKDALAEVFERPCHQLGVSTFSVRGDPSHAALYEWIQTAATAHGVENPDGWYAADQCFHKGAAKQSVVLYFGDHDPTGIRIPRSAEATTRLFMEHMGLDFPVEFRRIGITLEQARRLNLPPFPAKESAEADYARYVAEFDTTDAWELDALSPELLEQMVREEIEALFDSALHQRLTTGLEARRAEMRRIMQTAAWQQAATTFEE